MKGYNIEEQLAQKLGNRSISPSGQAWERIAFGRQQQTAKKKKKQWYTVAAAILLFCIGGYFALYTTTQKSNTVAPAVVSGSNQKSVVIPENHVQHAVVVTQEKEAKGDDVNSPEVTNLAQTIQVFPEVAKEAQQTIAISNIGIENHKEAAIVNTTVKNAVVQSQEDLLLEKALREVALARPVTKKTNDSVLLKEVEAEMDAYYREKALRFFSLKYKKIRIVVTDNH